MYATERAFPSVVIGDVHTSETNVWHIGPVCGPSQRGDLHDTCPEALAYPPSSGMWHIEITEQTDLGGVVSSETATSTELTPPTWAQPLRISNRATAVSAPSLLERRGCCTVALMNRRDFTTMAGAMLAAPLAAQNTTQPAILEIRRITMRTTQENQMQRTSDYLAKGAMPALQRAGAGPLGFFGSVIAEESPFIVTLTQFPSVAAWETMRAKQSADPEYRKAREAYNSASGRSYERLEISLLRCFSSVPAIEVPPAAEGSGRIFELRQYESPNGSTLERKIRMFNEGEIGIFRKNGMRPVFFGEMIAGTKMPNLVYMLAFDSMAARVSAWSAFGSDPAWKELRSKPGYSDAEIVSNISNSILSGLPFSPIR